MAIEIVSKSLDNAESHIACLFYPIVCATIQQFSLQSDNCKFKSFSNLKGGKPRGKLVVNKPKRSQFFGKKSFRPISNKNSYLGYVASDRVCLTENICIDDMNFGEILFGEKITDSGDAGIIGLAPSECSTSCSRPSECSRSPLCSYLPTVRVLNFVC